MRRIEMSNNLGKAVLPVEKIVMCDCGYSPITEPHSCLYEKEINGNDNPKFCTCCDDCIHDCCIKIYEYEDKKEN